MRTVRRWPAFVLVFLTSLTALLGLSLVTPLASEAALAHVPYWDVVTLGYGPPPAELYEVTGTVFVDQNENGVQDAAEPGYDGATVQLDGPDSAIATTSNAGNYRFDDVSAGTYVVSLDVPEGFTATTENPVQIALTGDTSVDFGIVPPPPSTYTLSGTVYVDANGNGVQEPGEQGYTGADVALTGAAEQSTTTENEGRYSFPALGEGSYTVTLATPPGYAPTTSNPVNLTVSADTAVNFGIAIDVPPTDYGFLDTLRLPWRCGVSEPRYVTQDWAAGHEAQGFALDFSGPIGSDVLAPIGGTLVIPPPASDLGYHVRIEAPGGWTIILAHLLGPPTAPAGPINQGDIVGMLGASGQATGSHIHFEARLNNAAPDAEQVERIFGYERDHFRFDDYTTQLLSNIGTCAPKTPATTITSAITRTWEQADEPVSSGAVNRTWLWGAPHSEPLIEPYAEGATLGAPERWVQYFDKSRMEVTNPAGDPDSIWYVTNGLLVVELITGQVQLGDATFAEFTPASVNVAGDMDDPTGPTYAAFANVLDAAPLTVGATLTQRIDRDGNVTGAPAWRAGQWRPATTTTSRGIRSPRRSGSS